MMLDVALDDFAREMRIDLLRIYDTGLWHGGSSNIHIGGAASDSYPLGRAPSQGRSMAAIFC